MLFLYLAGAMAVLLLTSPLSIANKETYCQNSPIRTNVMPTFPSRGIGDRNRDTNEGLTLLIWR